MADVVRAQEREKTQSEIAYSRGRLDELTTKGKGNVRKEDKF